MRCLKLLTATPIPSLLWTAFLRLWVISSGWIPPARKNPRFWMPATEIFNLLVKNKNTKEISNDLYISEKTVRNHISNCMQKLECKSRTNAVIELLKLGEISL